MVSINTFSFPWAETKPFPLCICDEKKICQSLIERIREFVSKEKRYVQGCTQADACRLQ